jgi:hypothetical protein
MFPNKLGILISVGCVRVKFGCELRWFARAKRHYGQLRSCAVTNEL